MANQTLLTNASKFSSVKQMYYSPISKVQDIIQTQMYCFLAHVDPWADVNNPPVPTQDQKSLKQIMKSIFVAKHIGTNNISPVIHRQDWTSGSIYDYYRDDIEMLSKDLNGALVYNFYVNNKYDQVFKCLWNNNGNPSTIEPYFEPGTYGTNNIFQGIDGYKWKYMYTIDQSSKIAFMDSTWIPVPVKKYSSNPLVNPSVGYGNIDVMNITNPGSGYNSSNAAINVIISGSSTTTAIGTAVVTNGAITDIIVTNTGANYTSANVSIQSTQGFGATAIAPISPIGGHGLDALSELGCNNVMITSTFTGPELTSGVNMIPTDITYYQLGILINPTSIQTSPDNATGSIYKTTTDIFVAGGFGTYISDEIVYQGDSLATATFYATVLSFDAASNTLKTINTNGQIITNAQIKSTVTNTIRTTLAYNLPDLIALSGDIAYIDNRNGISRSTDGIEQFKIVLSY